VQLLWRQAALIWHAKGYSHEEAADALAAKFGTNKGFSRSRISTLAALEREMCSPKVSDLILNELAVIDAAGWAAFQPEMEAALEALAGPPITSRDLREVVKEAASSVMDVVRSWLDTAGSTLHTFVESRLVSHGAQLDTTNAKLASHGAQLHTTNGKLGSVESKLESQDAKLDTLQATANHTDARVELMDTKADANESRRRKDARFTRWALVGLYPVVLLAQCYHAPPAPPAPAQGITVNLWQGAADAAGKAVPGSAPVVSDLRTFLGAILSPEMGKNEPAEQFVPDKPLQGQKLPPCNTRLGEEEPKGGCWGGMISVKPPCGLLYRYGDVCYRPIAADPSKGVGMVREAPGQEQHKAQH